MRMMMKARTIGLTALALLATASIAVAQGTMQQAPSMSPGMSDESPLSLSDQQKQMIWQSVGKMKNDRAPTSFQASVGSDVPAGVALHNFPPAVSRQVPGVRNFSFAKIQDEILIIDPANKRVVDTVAAR